MTSPADPPRSPGQPGDYIDGIAMRVCELLADGKSLREVCERDDMPSRSTILRWLASRPSFAAAYAQARELGCDLIFEEALQEALAARPATTQAARLHWDARRYHISKVMPKKYGDEISTEVSGPGGAAITLQAVAPP
jgi:hypothetical protein